MSLLDDLAESRIVAAQERGEFDDLAAAGAPVKLDDDSLIAQEWRMVCRVLRNAGYLPPEVSVRKEIAKLRGLVVELAESDERQRALRRLEYLKLAVSASRRPRSLCLDEAEYRERSLARLERWDDD